MNKRIYTLPNRKCIIEFLKYTSIPDKKEVEIMMEVISVYNLENEEELLKIIRYNGEVIKIIIINENKVSTDFIDYKTIDFILCESCYRTEQRIENNDFDINCNCDSQSYEPRYLSLDIEQDISDIDTVNLEYFIESSVKSLKIEHKYYEF
jgi:hypothetical protein